jgi:thiamine-phosphate pyrophosphorylase
MSKLYLISPPQIDEGFASILEDVLKTNKVEVFQLRLKDAVDYNKKLPLKYVEQQIRLLQPVCHKYKVPFIINDYIELIHLCDGVHLGEDDMDTKKARKLIGGNKVLGRSCYDSKHLAYEAAENGANYVAFGAFFPTKSKPQEKLRTAPLSMLDDWTESSIIPCVAIGGITSQNKHLVAKADFIAVIGCVWNNDNPAASVIKL